MSDLFTFAASGPHSCRSAPETSRIAAEKFKAKHGSWRERVNTYAISAGGPFTDEDLAVLADNRQEFERSVRPRRTELANERWILNTGRRQVINGREQVLWIHRSFVDNPPPLRPRGRPQTNKAVQEREAVCRWLRAKVEAGWSSDLLSAADMIEAENHLK